MAALRPGRMAAPRLTWDFWVAPSGRLGCRRGAEPTLRHWATWPGPATALAVRALHARPELDDDLVGAYMQDAMERGGYRAALEYYDSKEAEKSDVPWHRIKARGWLLGRLGLYDRVNAWLEEAAAWPDFDHFSTAGTCQCSPRRTPALWLEAPRPEGRNAVGRHAGRIGCGDGWRRRGRRGATRAT